MILDYIHLYINVVAKNIYIKFFFFFKWSKGLMKARCPGTMKFINWPCLHPVLDST